MRYETWPSRPKRRVLSALALCVPCFVFGAATYGIVWDRVAANGPDLRRAATDGSPDEQKQAVFRLASRVANDIDTLRKAHENGTPEVKSQATLALARARRHLDR